MRESEKAVYDVVREDYTESVSARVRATNVLIGVSQLIPRKVLHAGLSIWGGRVMSCKAHCLRVGEFSDWSACISQCVGGIKSRYASLNEKPMNGGECCERSPRPRRATSSVVARAASLDSGALGRYAPRCAILASSGRSCICSWPTRG